MTGGATPRSADWWRELDDCVLACLGQNGAMTPAEVARHVGVPEAAAVSLLCLLIAEGRVRLRLVEPAASAAGPRDPREGRVAPGSPRTVS